MRSRSWLCMKRRDLLATLVTLAILFASPFPILALAEAPATSNALPSWNDGAAKQAIVDFVKATTDPSSPNFVPPEARIATFDQDGTLWVEHPYRADLRSDRQKRSTSGQALAKRSADRSRRPPLQASCLS